MSIKTIRIGGNIPVKCKCGNYPTLGSRFWYKSKYDDCIVEGIVGKIDGDSITSTKGVSYKNFEIEVERLDIVREEKLNKLGINE